MIRTEQLEKIKRNGRPDIKNIYWWILNLIETQREKAFLRSRQLQRTEMMSLSGSQCFVINNSLMFACCLFFVSSQVQALYVWPGFPDSIALFAKVTVGRLPIKPSHRRSNDKQNKHIFKKTKHWINVLFS